MKPIIILFTLIFILFLGLIYCVISIHDLCGAIEILIKLNQKLTLTEYAEKAGKLWILNNSEIICRYKKELKTFDEWEILFDL